MRNGLPPIFGRSATLRVLSVMIVAMVAQAQTSKSRALPTVSCPEASAKAACHSFQELYSSHDPELLDELSKGHDYVCFLPTNEDVFYVVWFTGPNRYWREDKESHLFTQIAGAMLVRYRNGIFDENASGPLYTMEKWSTTTMATITAAR